MRPLLRCDRHLSPLAVNVAHMDDTTPDPKRPAHAHRRLTTAVLQSFLDHAADQGFVIFSNPAAPDEYIQFKRSGGVVYGEAGSRQWDVPASRRALSAGAEAALAAEGFTHGGLERNYACDDLAQSAPYLAELVDRLFAVAYGSAVDRPVVTSDIDAVRATTEQMGGRVGSLGPSQRFDRELHYRRLQEPLRTGPGLAVRAGRALRGNFFDQLLDSEDVIRFRAAVEAVQTFDELPPWAQDWIRKAEEGPLRVRLQPPV
jgi:hypothetical protein